MALPQAHRLRHRRDFSAVYQNGIRRTGSHFVLRALNQSKPARDGLDVAGAAGPQPTQIGISISQKVSKRAVVRNRIKRQIRAAMRQLLPQLTPGWWLVVVVRSGAQGCDYSQILQELEQLLAEAKVLHGHS